MDDLKRQLEAKTTVTFKKSPRQPAFEVLDHPDLQGDWRPSVMIDHMLTLLLQDVPRRHLFFALVSRHLPAVMRDQLPPLPHPLGARMSAVSTSHGRYPSPFRGPRCRTPMRPDSCGLPARKAVGKVEVVSLIIVLTWAVWVCLAAPPLTLEVK